MVLREVLAGNGHVSELSRRLGVSPATVRRDLQHLSRTGRATRTYGGAVGGPRPLELSLHQKDVRNQREKEAIARYAASLIADGDSVILDAGTTVGRLATQLRDRSDLTVFTNGVSSITTLSDSNGIALHVLGGQLRHISQAFIGPLAEIVLRHITADKAFLGVDGLSAEGISCPTSAHSSLKGMMAARASEVFVLADHTKLLTRPYHYWAPLDRAFTLITDSGAAAEDLAAVRDAGGTIVTADVSDSSERDP